MGEGILVTSAAFGRDMSCKELWLALWHSHKRSRHMAGPSDQSYVYINKINNCMCDAIFWLSISIGDSLENNSKRVTFTKSYYFRKSIEISSNLLTLDINI